MTRKELIKEVAIEQYGNDTCRAAKHFMKGMQYAFDYALQEARGVIVEHFGTGDDYADEVECMLNILEERI